MKINKFIFTFAAAGVGLASLPQKARAENFNNQGEVGIDLTFNRVGVYYCPIDGLALTAGGRGVLSYTKRKKEKKEGGVRLQG